MENSNNDKIEELAKDFLKLMPLFRDTVFKPMEKAVTNNLSPMQFHVIMHLHSKGTITMSELAAATGTVKQQLTPIVDKLVDLNYVERAHDKKDRRTVKISVTEAGLSFLEENKAKLMDMVKQRFEKLSQEDIVSFHDAIKVISQIAEKL